MRRIPAPTTVIAALALLCLCPSAPAAAAGLGLKAGTLGLGAEAAFDLGPHFGLRLGAYAGSASATLRTDNFDYDADLELANGALFLDWFPTAGSFRLSGGVVGGDRIIEGTAPLSQALDDGVVLPPGVDLGRLEGRLEADSVAPYVGIGWGRAEGTGRVAFTFDLGVVAQGAPGVSLELVTPLPIDQIPGLRDLVDALLAAEAAELEREAEDYDLYPVVALGLLIRF